MAQNLLVRAISVLLMYDMASSWNSAYDTLAGLIWIWMYEMQICCCLVLGIHGKIDGEFLSCAAWSFPKYASRCPQTLQTRKVSRKTIFQRLWVTLLAWKLLLSKWLLCCMNLWKVLGVFQLRGCCIPWCWELIVIKGFLWPRDKVG